MTYLEDQAETQWDDSSQVNGNADPFVTTAKMVPFSWR